MPMYEFGCPYCGVVSTGLYKMGENGEKLTCSGCGTIGLMKHISSFASLGASGVRSRDCSQNCHGNCKGCY